MNKGFTLIEMLVVVLIMGVLASVALPQYQRAVLKSRFVSVMPNTSSVRAAQEAYFLQHRRYAWNMEDLDVQLQENLRMRPNLMCAYIMSQPENTNNRLVMYLENSKNYSGQTHCEARVGDEQANWLCRDGLKGVPIGRGSSMHYNAYSLNGGGDSSKQLLCMDANGDGRTDISDVTYVIDGVLNHSPDPEKSKYDINGDDCLSIEDPQCLIQYILDGGGLPAKCLETVASENCENPVED